MPTPRSLLHLNGADSSTTVTNSVTGGSAVAWSFIGGAITTGGPPWFGSGMAQVSRYQYFRSAPVSPAGDWTLACRIGISNESDNGQLAIISQGQSGTPGSWALLMGNDGADLYFFRQGSPDVGIDGSLDSGQATTITNKLKAGNAFMVVQYISGVLSIGVAGASDTTVTRILSGAFTGGTPPTGAFHFNGRFDSSGNPYADSGGSRIDEVVYQDGGAIWPTYPFTKPTGEYAFASGATANGTIVDASDVLVAVAQVAVAASGTIRDRSDAATGAVVASIAAVATVRDAPDVAQAAAQAGIRASASVADGSDTVQASAVAPISVAGVAADLGDVAQGTAALIVSTSGVAFDAPDTVAADGANWIGVVGTATDAPDAVAGGAAVAITAVGSVRDIGDVVSASTVPSAGVTAAIFDTPDLVQAAAVVGVRVTAALRDASDQVVASAQSAVVASGAVGDGSDVLTAQAFVGAVPIAVVGAVVDSGDTLAAMAKAAIAVAGAVYDTPDLVLAQAAVVRPAIEASALVVDAPDIVASQAVASIAALFARTDASDIVIASASTAIRAAASVFDDADFVTGFAAGVPLPVIDAVGKVYDASDWLIAFVHSGDIEITPTELIRTVIPAERRAWVMREP